ncbi:hypothetical protein [Actinoplanes sp. NPDC049118]|uniref:hypothetical protein n=1 Tax=Actinoplanes sp. NPDC049118 TaxID=3155769 RepID=UPI0033ED885D
MANRKGRRRFGNVRKLPSGRFQARYLGPDGIERTAPNTFDTERLAGKWLTLVESEIIRGDWQAPEAGDVRLAEYGKEWIAHRRLQPRTRENYEDLFRLHLEPFLGNLSLVPGYDRYHTPERPVATIVQVLALAEQMSPRYTALILVAAFSGLRWGELAALRRCDVDQEVGTVRVPRKLAALKSGMEFGPPKSAAGIRVVALPVVARTALAGHLGGFTDAEPEALVFTGDKGTALRTGNFRRAVKWSTALEDAGMPARVPLPRPAPHG